MEDIYIESLMTHNVVTVSSEMEIKQVIRCMRDSNYSCLLIAENDIPIGILTERDVVQIIADHEDSSHTLTRQASEFMSSPLITITNDESLFNALNLIHSKMIRHLPVVSQEGKVVGMLTQTDLVNAHFKVFESIKEIIENSIDKRLHDLLEVNEKLKALSLEDPLLGVGNRRSMEVDLQHTHAAALRYKRPYSIMLFDLDYFKLFNDTYGHPAGDVVLQKVANHIGKCIRGADRLYRYGGEELLLIMPETPLENVVVLAQRIIEGLYQQKIKHKESPFGVLTLSAGVGSGGPGLPNNRLWSNVVSQADRGLYQAKNNGRNQFAIVD